MGHTKVINKEMSKEVSDIIQRRRSCRQYLRKEIPQELIDQVINAGRLAPTGGNQQPTHFYVVKNNNNNNNNLHQRIGIQIQNIMEATNPGIKAKAKEHKASNALFYDPSCVIFITVNKKAWKCKEIDIGIQVGYMMIMAESLGLATLPAALPKWFGEEIIKKELKIKEEEEEFMLSLSLGYQDPEEEKEKWYRKEMSEMVTYIN